jgi:hypothetical protein
MLQLRFHAVMLFNTHHLASFAAFISKNPDAARYVRYLWVAPRTMSPSDFYVKREEIWDSDGRYQHLCHFTTILRSCPNIASLGVHGAVFSVDALSLVSPTELVALAPLWDHIGLSPALPSVRRVYISLLRSIDYSHSLGLFFAGLPNTERIEEYMFDGEGGYEKTLEQAITLPSLTTYTFTMRASDKDLMHIDHTKPKVQLRTLPSGADHEPWINEWKARAQSQLWTEVLPL